MALFFSMSTEEIRAKKEALQKKSDDLSALLIFFFLYIKRKSILDLVYVFMRPALLFFISLLCFYYRVTLHVSLK